MKNDKYAICNRQKKIKNSQVNPEILAALNEQQPETENRAIIVVRQREFPAGRRYIIVVRLATERRRYIVKEDSDGIRVVEWKTTKSNLPEREQDKEKQEEIAEAVENVIEETQKE